MRIASLADVKAKFSAYVDECQTQGPIVITRNGKPVAVLLAPQDDDDLERLILARSPRFQALLNQSRESNKAGKGLSSDEFWARAQQHSAESVAASEGSLTRSTTTAIAETKADYEIEGEQA